MDNIRPALTVGRRRRRKAPATKGEVEEEKEKKKKREKYNQHDGSLLCITEKEGRQKKIKKKNKIK